VSNILMSPHAEVHEQDTLDAYFDKLGRLTILQNEDTGWLERTFYILDEKNEEIALHCEKYATDQVVLIGKNGIQVNISIVRLPNISGCSVEVLLYNSSGSPLFFNAYGFKGGGESIQIAETTPWLYMHTSNLRHDNPPYHAPTGPLIRHLMPETTVIDGSTQGSIPACGFSRENGSIWLVEGAATENRHHILWNASLGAEGAHRAMTKTIYTWHGGHSECVEPGQSFNLETTLFLIVKKPLDQIFRSYIETLETSIDNFAGPCSPLKNEPVYCTWNYGNFSNIDESLCINLMDAVSNIQGGGYFQIDHGYQPQLSGESLQYISRDEIYDARAFPTPELDAYYPDPEAAWDKLRFPSGPVGFVSACRERKLRPSIWWSPRVAANGRIQHEHPDWILCDKNGNNFLSAHGYLMLDLSVTEVREFVEKCIDTICSSWGFEGIKLDFFSWMFSQPGIYFRNGGTGITWRRWLFGIIRKALGPSGYFLHCVSTPMGNPFLAQNGCNAYRAGLDISEGDWDHHLNSVAWMLPLITSTGSGTWYANLDSCGFAPGLAKNERRARLALAYISGGMLEFGGPINRLSEEELIDYQHIIDRCDQGGTVLCPDKAAFFGDPRPSTLVRVHAPDSDTARNHNITHTIGFFNWDDEPVVIGIPLSHINIIPAQSQFCDFWDGGLHVTYEQGIVHHLPPRTHILIDVVNIK